MSPVVDSGVPDHFGQTLVNFCSAFSAFVTVAVVGGLPALVVVIIVTVFYINGKSTVSNRPILI